MCRKRVIQGGRRRPAHHTLGKMQSDVVVVVLPRERGIEAPIVRGTRYEVHISPLLYSGAVTLDKDELERAMRVAYQNRTATHAFVLELKCTSADAMEFRMCGDVPHSFDARLFAAKVKPSVLEVGCITHFIATTTEPHQA